MLSSVGNFQCFESGIGGSSLLVHSALCARKDLQLIACETGGLALPAVFICTLPEGTTSYFMMPIKAGSNARCYAAHNLQTPSQTKSVLIENPRVAVVFS